MVYSLLAYAAAIAIKIVFQYLTYAALQASYRDNLWILGAYFGAQTVILEVGGAFLIATLAMQQGKVSARDAEAYGLGLGFWENAGYVGILGLVNLVTIYILLYSNTSAAFYQSVVNSRPDLFYTPSQALPLIAWGLLERVTSLLFHFSWGYLSIVAASTHQKKYLALALPLGLLDFTVPFANQLGLAFFESFIFLLGLVVLGATIRVTKSWRKQTAHS